MVVVSEDGFDEISPCFKTKVFEIDEDNTEKRYDINPADYGIEPCNDNDLAGGTAQENAVIALDLMEGKGNASVKHAVCLNAGAALYIGKKGSSIKEGYMTALNAVENGDVKKKLEQIKADTNGITSAA
jgi:anthranilate synthase/phosphoribosyltransferase